MKKLIILVCTFGIMLSSGVSFGAGDFSWPMFVPPTTGMGLCGPQDINRCRNERNCLEFGGYWFNNECNSSITCTDIAGCYSGTSTGNCPGYWLSGKVGVSINANCSFSSVSQYTVKSSGTITSRQGNKFSGSAQTDTNGCGQFSFTCSDNGTSVSCNMHYTNGKEASMANAYQGACRSSNQYLTETLAGNWTFSYTIISTWVDHYYLDINDVSEYPSGSDEYSIYGEDQYRNLVVAGYDPTYGDYSLFNPGSTIDMLFTFNYTNSNTVAGCYYQYSHSDESWSSCYPMNGVRTNESKSSDLVKSADISTEGEQQLIKEAEAIKQGNDQLTDNATLERLKSLRHRLIAE